MEISYFCIFVFIIYTSLLHFKKPVYIFTTDITPISEQEEFNYETLNSYLKKNYLSNYSIKTENNLDNLDNLKELIDLSYLNFELIHSSLLMDLFINKLREESTIIDGIKKFNFVEPTNFKNVNDYNIEISELAKAFNFFPPKDNNLYDRNWKIQIQLDSHKNLEGF